MDNTRVGHSIIPSVYEGLTGIGEEQALKHGLYLMDFPTGSGKSWACVAVAKKHLQREYPFDRKIWLLSNQNKNLDEFVKDLGPFGALRLKDQAATAQEYFDSHPDYVGEIRSCHYLDDDRADNECRSFFIDHVSKIKEGADQFGPDNSKDYNKYLREEVIGKNYLDVKRKLGSVIRSNVKSKNWSGTRVIETLKAQIPWCIDLFPDTKIDESRVIICTYKKFITAQKSFTFGSQYLWELCSDDIIMMDEFETSKNDFLDYSIDMSLRNGYDIIKSFVNIRHCLVSKTQPETVFAGVLYHKGKSKKAILDEIKERFNMIYDKFQLRKNLKSTDDTKDKAYNNIIFSNQSIQLESQVSFLKYETDRNYIVYKDQGTEDTVASLAYEASYAIHNLAKTIRYDFLPDYHQASEEEFTSYYDDLKSLYNTFGFDEECMSCLLTQNKIIDLKRELGIGKDKGMDSMYDSFPAMSFRVFENNVDNKESTVIRDYNVSYSPESWIVALAYKNTVLGLSATCREDTVFINYDLGFFRDKGILREIPFDFLSALEEEFDRRYDYNGNGLIDINVIVLGNSFSGIGEEYFQKREALKEYYTGILADADIEDPCINDFILAGGSKYFMGQWHRLISAIHCYLLNNGFAMLALTNRRHFIEERKKSAIITIIDRMKASLGITDEIAVEFLFTENFDDSFAAIRENKLNKGVRTIIFSNIDAVARGVNLTHTVTADNLDKTVIVDHLNDYVLADAGSMKTCFDYIYIEHKTFVGPQYHQGATHIETQKSFLSFAYGIATMFDHRDGCEITFMEAQDYLRTSLKLGFSMNDPEGDRYNPYVKYITKSHSYAKALYIYLAQIVGRITRTPLRYRQVRILLDDEWRQTDFGYIGEGNWVIPELRCIKTTLESYLPFKMTDHHSYATAQRNAMKLSSEYRNINRIIREGSEQVHEYMERLDEINRYILSHVAGVFDDTMVSDPDAQFAVMELPEGLDGYSFCKYWHNEMRRVERFEIYDASVGIGEERPVFSCSLRSMGDKLEKTLRLPGVRARFEREGWQTALPMPQDLIGKKRFILNPEAFMKWEGLLGEIAFEEFCRQHSIDIQPLPCTLFELADYSINGNIAVDVKNWRWDINEEGMADHIREKFDLLADAGYKALILVNLFPIMDEGKFHHHRICGKDRNIFSFSCLAGSSPEGSAWNIEALKTLNRAIAHYNKENES